MKREERKCVKVYLRKTLEWRLDMNKREQKEERESVEEVDAMPARDRSPIDMLSIHVRRLPTDEGFECPLQDRRPIKIPFVVCHIVYPFAIFVYGARGSTSDPLALGEPRSKVWPMSDLVKGLPPERDRQPTSSKQPNGCITRNCGSGTRKSP